MYQVLPQTWLGHPVHAYHGRLVHGSPGRLVRGEHHGSRDRMSLRRMGETPKPHCKNFSGSAQYSWSSNFLLLLLSFLYLLYFAPAGRVYYAQAGPVICQIECYPRHQRLQSCHSPKRFHYKIQYPARTIHPARPRTAPVCHLGRHLRYKALHCRSCLQN